MKVNLFSVTAKKEESICLPLLLAGKDCLSAKHHLRNIARLAKRYTYLRTVR
jgi:hypothetical protein